MDIEVIHCQAIDVVRRYKSTQAEVLGVLMLVEKYRVFEKKGYPNLFTYCTDALKLSESDSYVLIGIARKSQEVPLLKEKIEAGEIHISNARRIVPVLNKQNQEVWLDKAAKMSKRALEFELVKENPVACLPKERIKPLTEEWSELRLSIPKRLEDKLARVKDLSSQKRQTPVELFEALEEMANLFLEKNDPVKKAERVQKKRQLVPGLKVPAKRNDKRVPPPALIKNAVQSRDQGQCTALLPSGKRCPQKRWVQMHHPWRVSDGGMHSEGNLETLCFGHHRLEHVNQRYYRPKPAS